MRIADIIDGYLCKNEDGSYSWSINAEDNKGNSCIIEIPKVTISIINNPTEYGFEIKPKMLTIEPNENILFTIMEY